MVEQPPQTKIFPPGGGGERQTWHVFSREEEERTATRAGQVWRRVPGVGTGWATAVCRPRHLLLWVVRRGGKEEEGGRGEGGLGGTGEGGSRQDASAQACPWRVLRRRRRLSSLVHARTMEGEEVEVEVEVEVEEEIEMGTPRKARMEEKEAEAEEEEDMDVPLPCECVWWVGCGWWGFGQRAWTWT